MLGLMIIAAVIASTALSVGCSSGGHRAEAKPGKGSGDFTERDETSQSVQLSAGAEVTIAGINGSVEVATSESDKAEIHIIRSARNREDLEYRKVIIEHTPTSLVVRGEKDRERSIFMSLFRRSHNVRQQVTLRLPRQVELRTTGINGPVTIGEINGSVRVSGVNGRVSVAQAAGRANISGINGPVEATLTELGDEGVRVSGVNGNIELRFTENVNADLRVSGFNGDVDAELPNLVMQEKRNRSNFRGRIGEGGAPINISGVNGRLRLVRATAASAGSATAAGR
jgi:DUF4097 and DUF4098 domain-containing protein YvlB